MSYLYRCKKYLGEGKQCDTRVALPRPVERYTRKPKCENCGAELKYMDKWQRKKNRKTTCRCDGLPYPHRKGSSVWCIEHPTGPTEQDYEERYGY